MLVGASTEHTIEARPDDVLGRAVELDGRGYLIVGLDDGTAYLTEQLDHDGGVVVEVGSPVFDPPIYPVTAAALAALEEE